MRKLAHPIDLRASLYLQIPELITALSLNRGLSSSSGQRMLRHPAVENKEKQRRTNQLDKRPTYLHVTKQMKLTLWLDVFVVCSE